MSLSAHGTTYDPSLVHEGLTVAFLRARRKHPERAATQYAAMKQLNFNLRQYLYHALIIQSYSTHRRKINLDAKRRRQRAKKQAAETRARRLAQRKRRRALLRRQRARQGRGQRGPEPARNEPQREHEQTLHSNSREAANSNANMPCRSNSKQELDEQEDSKSNRPNLSIQHEVSYFAITNSAPQSNHNNPGAFGSALHLNPRSQSKSDGDVENFGLEPLQINWMDLNKSRMSYIWRYLECRQFGCHSELVGTDIPRRFIYRIGLHLDIDNWYEVDPDSDIYHVQVQRFQMALDNQNCTQWCWGAMW